MSVYVSGSVWRFSRSKGGARLVLLALADIADDNGVAYPKWDTSIDNIASKCNISRRAVQYSIRELQELGELSVQVHNGASSNTFQIHLDRNRPLFDGPPEIQPVGKSDRDGIAPVQPASPEGRNLERQPTKPIAPNPSVRLSRLGSSIPPGPEKPVDKTGPAKPGMPKHYAAWIEVGISAGARAWAKEQGLDRWLQLHWDFFVDYIAQPAQWKRYTDLDAAFRNCMRSDWGDVRMKAERAARANGKAPGGAEPARPVTCRYCPKPWAAIHDGIPACGSPEHIERAKRREPAPEPTHA